MGFDASSISDGKGFFDQCLCVRCPPGTEKDLGSNWFVAVNPVWNIKNCRDSTCWSEVIFKLAGRSFTPFVKKWNYYQQLVGIPWPSVGYWALYCIMCLPFKWNNSWIFRINLPLFFHRRPSYYIYIYIYIYMFLPCRPFVAITTLSTGLVGVEVTSVSWHGQLTVGV